MLALKPERFDLRDFGSQPIELCGKTFIADQTGALFWPAERALIVADLHLARLHRLLLPERIDHFDREGISSLVRLVSLEILVCVANGRDANNHHKRHNRRGWEDRAHPGDKRNHHVQQKEVVADFSKLFEHIQGQEGQQRVLCRTDVVGGVAEFVVALAAVAVNRDGLCNSCSLHSRFGHSFLSLNLFSFHFVSLARFLLHSID